MILFEDSNYVPSSSKFLWLWDIKWTLEGEFVRRSALRRRTFTTMYILIKISLEGQGYSSLARLALGFTTPRNTVQ